MVDLPLVTSAEDPLAQPTRARLFELLGGGPASTAELAAKLHLHSNGVRNHLDRMKRDGLVVRTREHQRVGRPRDIWSLAPDARPGGRRQSAYADLVRWLARALGADPRAARRVQATGLEIGRELAPEKGGTFDGTLERVLTRLGFQPEADERGDGHLVIRLCNCPYRDAVRENRDVVCGLHRGLTEGLLAELEGAAELAAFEPRDPDEAGCVVEVRAPAGAAR